MAPSKPAGKTKLMVNGLGEVEGWVYPSGVRQFTGIPYGSLAKRWTRAVLATSWPDDYHDGTKLGASAPNPPEYNSGEDVLLPVPDIAHFNKPIEDELNCLVMNITIPSSELTGPFPVMCYIHGGSFLYGGANRSCFDGVNLVTFASARGTPVVAINFNYRVGLGGFLASNAIRADLAKDGFGGNGNFGLTDQQLALKWIQTYVSSFAGDKDNVTIYGESAGGMSVAHQIAAKVPAPFQRAIEMSGTLNTIPTWPEERHEAHFQALLRYLHIDSSAPDALDQLRKIPQETVAAATIPVEGLFVCTGNPCDDGYYHAECPHFDRISSPPKWLKAFMLGDVYHEAMIFSSSLADDDYASLYKGLSKRIGDEKAAEILEMYDITPDLPVDQARLNFQDLAGDTTFKTQNYVALHQSKLCRTYGYHFDQRCTLDTVLKGLAYHALDILYIFPNLCEKMTSSEIKLSEKMTSDWIDFVYGEEPWERFGIGQRWMVFGPNDEWRLKSEDEDEETRRYSRINEIIRMGIYADLVAAVDDIVAKRERMGAF